MKKNVFVLILLLFILVSCSENGRNDGDEINIVCTIFPQYDWTRQIIGEETGNFNLSLLISSRVDLHSYSPSIADIAQIKTCDVFIYVGGASDDWVDDVLSDANADMITLNLMDILGDLIIDDEHDEHDDEHIWLSLKNADIICEAITEILAELDPENAAVYRSNYTAYAAELTELDAEFLSVVENANTQTLVFADRFPFGYLARDYGLTYYAAFSGCSAETEASFVTIISLANRLNQYNLSVIMVTESSDRSIAHTVRDNTDTGSQEILVMDSMQSVTATDVQNGVTYLSVMESNLHVLENALR